MKSCVPQGLAPGSIQTMKNNYLKLKKIRPQETILDSEKFMYKDKQIIRNFEEPADPGKRIVVNYVRKPASDDGPWALCTGMAASMASVLLAAGTHGKRSILPHSRVMIHQPMGGAEGQASDIEITAREILKLKGELYDILAEHTGKSLEDITRDADRDFWMTAEEAVNYGMVDEIIRKSRK